MNKARIVGIVIFIIGIYLIILSEKSENGYLLGILMGIITGIGFGLIVIGKFKFWIKD
jgi:drug/metabolite transporter (DMT)-like permease